MTVDPPLFGSIALTPAQCAALKADKADGSDRVVLVAVHPGELDLDALAHALMELRRRHDILRSTIRYTEHGPVSTVGTRTMLPVELMAERPPRPADGFPPKRFDLASGPLVHVTLCSDDGGPALLGFQAHAVALDEETMRHLVHELGLLYRYFASDGPIPPVTQVGYREHAAGVRSTIGRVPKRLPVVSHEVGPAIADRIRLIASSRGLPVALLVLAAWIATGSATSAQVAVSLSDPSGRRPLGPARNRILVRAEAGSTCDIVTLAEHLHAAAGDGEPDDGITPVSFTFADGRAGAGPSPFEVLESSTMLARSDVALAAYGTPAMGWLLRLARHGDIAGRNADRAALARTAAMLEEAGAALVDEELL